MPARKLWIETVGLSVTAAVVFAIAIALVTATAVLAFGQKDSPETPELRTISGMLTDSKCAARHPSSSGMSSAQCILFCIKKGASWAIVNGDAVYIIKGDSPAFDKLAGERVTLTGMFNGNSVQVQSIEPAKP